MTAPRRGVAATIDRPKLGFLGVGWIGRKRMQAILNSGFAEAAVIVEPSEEMRMAALDLAPAAATVHSIDELLQAAVDGVVIATPSGLHAEQSIRALERGKAVFCQKPLGRRAEEVARVIDTARANDRLLAVDLSYRHTKGIRCIKKAIDAGEIGKIFGADLQFHNAYGPDKLWFYDRRQSGGGCVMDLGIHLVDLALWTLDFPKVVEVTSHLFAAGVPWDGASDKAEDYAVATLRLETGAAVTVSCSWRLHAGRDAVISASFYGTQGGLNLANVDGSFYDFTAERFSGTSRASLAVPPDQWGGRAAVDWAQRLASGERYDPAVARLVDVANVLDRIYSSGPG